MGVEAANLHQGSSRGPGGVAGAQTIKKKTGGNAGTGKNHSDHADSSSKFGGGERKTNVK